MKTLSLPLSLVFCISLFSFPPAQAQQQPVPSKIEKVTVFLKGAQIARSAEAQLPAGRTELIFKDISPNLDKQSIQLKGEGAFTILSVSHQLNYLQEQAKRAEIATLEGEQRNTNLRKKEQQNLLSVYQKEQQMLEKNQAIGGANTGVSTAELRQAVDFQRQRMTEVFQRQSEVQQELARLDSTLLKLQKQLVALNQEKETATSEIVVTVTAKAAAPAKFELTYYVHDAGWFANYDLRVKDVNSPIDLAFKANVFQQSGEDWKNVRLVLSNGDPTVSGQAQELDPWYLRFGYQQPPTAYQGGVGSGGITEVSGVVRDRSGEPLIGAAVLLKGSSIGTITDFDGRYTLKIPPTPATLVVNYSGFTTQEIPVNSSAQTIVLQEAGVLDEVVVTGMKRSLIQMQTIGGGKNKKSRADASIAQQNQEVYQPTTVDFEIELPYSIPSDGKARAVDIKSESVTATYEYFAAPKLEEAAFLTAYVTDWQELNLLDGEVNLFFEGAFLGKSLLDTRSMGDTLDISLGQDKGIVVQRNKLKEYSSRQFLGKNKTENRAFEIVVRNNKPQAVKVLVQDQFPISTDKNIVVEDLSYPGAELEADTQLLTWRLELAPREERKLELRYSVKYPRNEVLILE